MEWNIAGCYSRFQPYCNRAQLYTVPVKLRSCRRLDETGLALRSPSRFHPKENCIFLALLRSYPFAASAQGRSTPRSILRQRVQPNMILDRSSKERSFCLGGDVLFHVRIFKSPSPSAARDSLPLPVPPTRAARSCFRNTTRKLKTTPAGAASCTRKSCCHLTLRRNTPTGKPSGTRWRPPKNNGMPSWPGALCWPCPKKSRRSSTRR